MAELLMFQLVAPIGAFGAVAVGERRETAARPSHSGLIGLLGAALGLERADPRQAQFSASFAFAARCDRLGPLLADFHTAQRPPARNGRTWATRREELSGETNTTLTRRDYHTDCAFSIACLQVDNTVASLPEIAEALRRPRLTLYLGRKSCPLGMPPDPLVAHAETLRGAFDAYDAFRDDRQPEGFRWRKPEGEISLASVFCAQGLASAPGPAGGRREQRRDLVVDRKGWRFDLREEIVLPRLDGERAR